MKSNRNVPIIIGIVSLVLAVWLAVWVGGIFGVVGATLCTLFGWPSLKTGLFANDAEIEELTGVQELSEETAQKMENNNEPRRPTCSAFLPVISNIRARPRRA